MKKRFLTVCFILFLVSFGLAAQDTEPFVSHIKAESSNNLIRLTWTDAPGARGSVYIFRSARPFTGSVPANIRPVVVKYGEQYYIDDIDDMERIYYFIAASDTSGYIYDIILPEINSINVSARVREQPQTETQTQIQIVEALPFLESAWGISNLRASPEGEKVIIVYDSSDTNRRAVLYRSMRPVRLPNDLINAVIVQSGMTSPVVDFPVPGLMWYYAVIYEDEILSGDIRIRPGINTTVIGVRLSDDGETAEGYLRPIPLPILTFSDIMPEGSFLFENPQQAAPLSTGAIDMLNATRLPRAPLTLKTPRIFSVDLTSPSSGEDSALFQIIKEYFRVFDWEGARINLQEYLSLPRSMDVQARARFYFAQSLYFTGNYREALMEFLSIKTIYPVEVNSWIDAVLTALVY